MSFGSSVPGTSVPSGVAVSPGGPPGIPGPAATTTVVNGFTVPALGATVQVTLTSAAWLVPGQIIYVAGAGSGGTAGDFQVQSINGNLVTLLNLPASGGTTGGGDMSKAVYDTSNRGYVDHAALADSVPYLGITNAPLASVSGSGLMTRVTGVTTDYVDGTNNCRNLLSSIPVASNSQPGLLNQLSGNTTDFVDGTNNFQSLATAVAAALFTTWTPFTLTLSTSTGTITAQTSTCYYLRIGKTVIFNFWVSVTNIGTASGNTTLNGLPVPVATAVTFTFRETAVNGKIYAWTIGNGSTGGAISDSANANPVWANNVAYCGFGIYRTT
jgi:hypothetical protein